MSGAVAVVDASHSGPIERNLSAAEERITALDERCTAIVVELSQIAEILPHDSALAELLHEQARFFSTVATAHMSERYALIAALRRTRT